MLVAAGAALVSIWLVPQEYVGDYAARAGFLFWCQWVILTGAATIAAAVVLRALRLRRFPWTETFVSAAILTLADVSWRLMTAHDEDLVYKLVWGWIGQATPLIAIATWAVAVTLALGVKKEQATT